MYGNEIRCRCGCYKFLAAIILLFSSLLNAETIFTITDPRGDDYGAGSISYPIRRDFEPGDLDLVSVSAKQESDGTQFEATFANRIRVPGREAIDVGGTALNSIARFGFYTFNIDLYIDTDRRQGSGSTETLPGRKVQIDPAFAWEKMILLTPRPYEALDAIKRLRVRKAEEQRRNEKGRLDPEDTQQIQKTIAAEVEKLYFLPTRVRVIGKTVQFFVPSSFLGGPAGTEWAYSIAVSGSNIYEKIDLPQLGIRAPEAIFILGIVPGKSETAFGGGREDDSLQPPLIDIVVPAGAKQEEILRNYNLKTNTPVKLPGVVPAK